MNLKENSTKMVALLTTVCCLFSACKKKNNPDNGNKPELHKLTLLQITPIENLNQGTANINSHVDVTSRSSLKMNFRSYVGLGQSALGVTKPNYPRIKKMANGSYIMFYHNNQIGASCDYAISADLKTWSPKGKIYKNYAITDSKGGANERRFSTCDAVVLSNGDILAVASYRANIGYRERPLDAGLVLRRSKDNGNTWSDPIEIYQGVNWEPYLLQLPSGEIHCYFTDSDRTLIEGTDTGTAMVVSDDNGNNWTPSFGASPFYVLRTKHVKNGNTYFNNQMPSVIKLNNSNELAAALEANIGNYNISFAYSGEDGEWTHLAVTEEGPEDRNDLAFLGSAPYIRQFLSGETVLSYNLSSKFHLKVGDAKARHFGEAYTPFSGGYWGALELVDNHQIIGVMPNTGNGEVMLSRFILNHRINATQRNVTVDGDNSEWKDTDEALFVGEKSQAQATLRSAVDKDNVYFLIEVLDDVISSDDYATIFISPVTSNDTLGNEACRIKVSYDGMRDSYIYNGGWTNDSVEAVVKAAYRGTISQNQDIDHGYVVELAIPRSKLNIKSGQLLVNFSITDSGSSEDAIFNTTSTSTAKWIPVMGL
ncbi:Carbohydrate family 9 binding domain-like [Chitinophaga sp. CF118]|uniref:hypothetical protein n=1 Tax=Chitinophaga sp. CF118 TaxID=1884367 RepID=UPI0008E3448B|nr:hypothetical protein [Chitinophaga sp. CF118]SFE60289.1 Carbohydrate family 9 binding domain-like [Chitinophaga sp. CF118]